MADEAELVRAQDGRKGPHTPVRHTEAYVGERCLTWELAHPLLGLRVEGWGQGYRVRVTVIELGLESGSVLGTEG